LVSDDVTYTTQHAKRKNIVMDKYLLIRESSCLSAKGENQCCETVTYTEHAKSKTVASCYHSYISELDEVNCRARAADHYPIFHTHTNKVSLAGAQTQL